MSNPWDKEKWGVYMRGSDDIFAAVSFEQAVEKAHEFNQNILAVKNKVGGEECRSELFPMMWASVCLWSEIAECDHDPESTVWDI